MLFMTHDGKNPTEVLLPTCNKYKLFKSMLSID